MKLFWETKNFHHNDRQCPSVVCFRYLTRSGEKCFERYYPPPPSFRYVCHFIIPTELKKKGNDTQYWSFEKAQRHDEQHCFVQIAYFSWTSALHDVCWCERSRSYPQPISCFFSVLRQFKIVKPIRHSGKKQTSFKKQNCLCMLYGRETW
jgi:hypothetical protein